MKKPLCALVSRDRHVCIMSAPETTYSGVGQPHFLPKVREQVCEHYHLAYLRHTGVCLDNTTLPKRTRGCKGDKVVDAAWKTFNQTHVCNGRLRAQPRGITKDAFRKILIKYFAAWSKDRACPSASRKKPINLTDAETERLAKLLATPRDVGENKIYFDNIEEAARFKPEIRKLFEKSNATAEVLHQHLLATVPGLCYGPEDRAVWLCNSTLKGRRKLCDVWVGDHYWFVQRAWKVPRISTRASVHFSEALQQGAASPPPREVFWEPRWFGQHTFMIDATTFSDKEGPMHSRARHVYYDNTDVHEGTQVKPDPSPSQTTSIMVYCVIHKYLGLVLGPEIMFTGTKLKLSKQDKETQFASQGVRTW